ncbi:hypothetical protein [Sphingomonas sp. SUN039]|uniref:hypothetical protein n=1 Tax=Sphingomonas sp. SUN039 TaxID=2937787 RepID=UPI00216462BE|nr:hypothetical protein [Sphingomonas sp. SUN039]UVO54322.1 hypothetical protein M0209_09390 [Sphingomonas sp. SUN039]
MPTLDGGGGNDCIVTFDGGPGYDVKGGPGNDNIYHLPPSAAKEPDGFFDALCDGRINEYLAHNPKVEIAGHGFRFSEPLFYGVPIVTMTVIVLVALAVVIFRKPTAR